jgi:hypothetical protein
MQQLCDRVFDISHALLSLLLLLLYATHPLLRLVQHDNHSTAGYERRCYKEYKQSYTSITTAIIINTTGKWSTWG